jgi:hypothetical protein
MSALQQVFLFSFFFFFFFFSLGGCVMENCLVGSPLETASIFSLGWYVGGGLGLLMIEHHRWMWQDCFHIDGGQAI